MSTRLSIKQMSWDEKLRVMEALWTELCEEEDRIESPPWHAEVLDARTKRMEAGAETFVDWEAAKRELRNRLT